MLVEEEVFFSDVEQAFCLGIGVWEGVKLKAGKKAKMILDTGGKSVSENGPEFFIG
jgi:hypothetical protein